MQAPTPLLGLLQALKGQPCQPPCGPGLSCRPQASTLRGAACWHQPRMWRPPALAWLEVSAAAPGRPSGLPVPWCHPRLLHPPHALHSSHHSPSPEKDVLSCEWRMLASAMGHQQNAALPAL